MKSSFDTFLKCHEVQQLVHRFECLLTYRQETLGTNEKVQLALAKLGRFGVEDNSVRDKGALKRKMALFECVVLVFHMPVPALMLPQSSRRNKGQVQVHFGTVQYSWIQGK